MTIELDNVTVITKCRGETYDEADKRNKHFKDIGRQECIKEKDKNLIQMKKQKDYWRDKYRKAKQEVLDEIDNIDTELFLEDVMNVDTGKKIIIPKEIWELWDIYWQHIKEKLKSKIEGDGK